MRIYLKPLAAVVASIALLASVVISTERQQREAAQAVAQSVNVTSTYGYYALHGTPAQRHDAYAMLVRSMWTSEGR